MLRCFSLIAINFYMLNSSWGEVTSNVVISTAKQTEINKLIIMIKNLTDLCKNK